MHIHDNELNYILEVIEAAGVPTGPTGPGFPGPTGATGATGPCCTGPTGPGGLFVEATMSVGFAVPDNGGFVTGLIPFDVLSAGTLTGYNLATFIFTAPADGIYNMNGFLSLTGLETGVGIRNLEIVMNGNQITPGGSSTMNAAGRVAFAESYSTSLTAHLDAGETLQFSMVQNSGIPLAVGPIGCRLRISRIA